MLLTAIKANPHWLKLCRLKTGKRPVAVPALAIKVLYDYFKFYNYLCPL
jgi:hypothetical protein